MKIYKKDIIKDSYISTINYFHSAHLHNDLLSATSPTQGIILLGLLLFVFDKLFDPLQLLCIFWWSLAIIYAIWGFDQHVIHNYNRFLMPPYRQTKNGNC